MPPHAWYLRWLWDVKTCRLTIQGQAPIVVSCPPTTRPSPCELGLKRNPQGPLRRDREHSSNRGGAQPDLTPAQRGEGGGGLGQAGQPAEERGGREGLLRRHAGGSQAGWKLQAPGNGSEECDFWGLVGGATRRGKRGQRKQNR